MSGMELSERERQRSRAARRVTEPPAPESPPATRFAWPVLALGLIGGLLLWAALPPLEWSWLAWVAPVPWLLIVRERSLSGRRPYLAVWIASSVHWLAVLQGIRLPYWALYFGWAALSLYLAIYLPLFVALSRAAVHGWRLPLWLAAPMVWTGLELARGYMITGFSGALLGHTLVRWLPLIQISDLFGAYAVSFLVMLVAAALTEAILNARQRRIAVGSITAAAVTLASTLLYGYYRLEPRAEPAESPRVSVAMLQGTYDTIFTFDPQRNIDMFEQYLGLARRVSRERPEVQLLLWPESTFTENNPYWLVGDEIPVPANHTMAPSEYRQRAEERARSFLEKAQYVADAVNADRRVPAFQLVGVETVDLREDPPPRYNSALLLDPIGRPIGRYDKMHLVMFGEYIPLASWLPILYEWSPMGSGTSVGDGPEAFEIGGLRFAPTICFESFVPHHVRRQLVELERRGTPADVLVNLTHDGWFWGSSILDLHRTCAVFRAVEHRRPMLTAANPGLTAWIDGNGRIVHELPRHQEDYIVAEVERDTRASLYRRWGDWPVGICLAVSLLLGLLARFAPRREPTDPLAGQTPGEP